MTFLKKVFGSNSTTGHEKRRKEDGGLEVGISVAPSPLPSLPSQSSTTTTSSNPFIAPVDAILPTPAPPHCNLQDFEVHRTLGTGSFGRVCLVRHHPTGRYYAMKKLRKADVVRLKQVEHTNNERHLLAQVNHLFIVKMNCTFQDERHLYIILEYVCGGELFSLLRKVRVANSISLRNHY
jgi:serine/threonine protein kinase